MIPPDVRAIVGFRDEARCLRCGYGVFAHWHGLHHRKSKGAGGSKLWDTPQNLVTLCFDCHRHVHANPAESYTAGWLVRRNSTDDPATIPIPSYRGLVLLTADGGVEPYEAVVS